MTDNVRVVQITCGENMNLNPESFCIWIAIPENMVVEKYLEAGIETGLEISDTNYAELVPGVDFIIKAE